MTTTMLPASLACEALAADPGAWPLLVADAPDAAALAGTDERANIIARRGVSVRRSSCTPSSRALDRPTASP